MNAYNEVEIFVGCAPEGETLAWFFIGKLPNHVTWCHYFS
jgi:hypothetical protein